MGKNPGEIIVRTNSVARGAYIFEMSETPDDETSWVEVSSGTKASAIVSELTTAMKYYFRVKVIGKNGPEPISDVISAIAH
jgi:hypothetical protein